MGLSPEIIASIIGIVVTAPPTIAIVWACWRRNGQARRDGEMVEQSSNGPTIDLGTGKVHTTCCNPQSCLANTRLRFTADLELSMGRNGTLSETLSNTNARDE
ncbi:hypothetical protein B0T10DRAFT_496646 [Thelonectria olida]|uniref:Uncharacterized protein n=1 Tax=Thelonectria olida TaxID=1576542 RepID=A0A9P8VXI8_9HYPO|nr:hypothetical protein B0T10DRAFT_496646 [Thelonectria olida]